MDLLLFAIAAALAQSAPCHVTACFAGAGPANPESTGFVNWRLGQACRELPGLVERCRGDDCDPVWGSMQTRRGLRAMAAAVRDNPDNCRVSVVAYSWGAVNSAKKAGRYLDHVDVAVLIDPYQPQLGGPFRVSEAIDEVWVYTHRATPERDCSRRLPLGPYGRMRPDCEGQEGCHVLDYGSIGHCRIFTAASYHLNGHVAEGLPVRVQEPRGGHDVHWSRRVGGGEYPSF